MKPRFAVDWNGDGRVDLLVGDSLAGLEFVVKYFEQSWLGEFEEMSNSGDPASPFANVRVDAAVAKYIRPFVVCKN